MHISWAATIPSLAESSWTSDWSAVEGILPSWSEELLLLMISLSDLFVLWKPVHVYDFAFWPVPSWRYWDRLASPAGSTSLGCGFNDWDYVYTYTRELVHRRREYKYLGLYIYKVEQIYTCTYTHVSWWWQYTCTSVKSTQKVLVHPWGEDNHINVSVCEVEETHGQRNKTVKLREKKIRKKDKRKSRKTQITSTKVITALDSRINFMYAATTQIKILE